MKTIVWDSLAAKSRLDLVKYALLTTFVVLVAHFYGSMWEFYRHMGHLAN